MRGGGGCKEDLKIWLVFIRNAAVAGGAVLMFIVRMVVRYSY